MAVSLLGYVAQTLPALESFISINLIMKVRGGTISESMVKATTIHLSAESYI
jgi:hypothetical protein